MFMKCVSISFGRLNSLKNSDLTQFLKTVKVLLLVLKDLRLELFTRTHKGKASPAPFEPKDKAS